MKSKKRIAVLLSILMLLSIFPISSIAIENLKINIEAGKAVPGGTFEAEVIIENNPGIASAGIHVTFSEGLLLVGAKNGKVFPGGTMIYTQPRQLSNGVKMKNSANFSWMGTSEVKPNEIADGTIITFTFEVEATANIGDVFEIKITPDFVDNNADTLLIEPTVYTFVALPEEEESCAHRGGTATCVSKAICDICKTAYGEFNSNNHERVVTDKAVSSTCTSTGLTEGSHCNSCGTVVVKQSVVASAGHRFTDWTVVTPATTEKEGTEQRVCTACGAKEMRAIEKLPQTVPEAVDGSVIIDLIAKRVSIKMKTSAASFKDMVIGVKITVTDKNGQALADNALIGTGCIVNIVSDSGAILDSYTVIVRMDTNGDGKANSSDARDVLRVAARLDNLDGVYAVAGDTDGDGKLTSSDARKILRVAAGLDPAQ